MNSNSKFYDDYDPCKKEKCCNEYDSCCRKEKEREKEKEKKVFCPTIVKCGCPGSARVPLGSTGTFTPASLTLNTKCFCNPCTKLEVTSNIIPDVLTTTGTLSFQVTKQCRNQFAPVPVGPAFTYSQLLAGSPAQAFSFFICDCDTCDHDCCTYRLDVTATTAPLLGGITINNATLGAITTDSACNICCND
jgi:hypothetical protein